MLVMDYFSVYRWMLADGLELKGAHLCLFGLIFSYTKSMHVMFESEVTLAKCLGYKRESINVALKGLIKDGLIVRLSRHKGLQTYDYCVDVFAVARMLGAAKCKDSDLLKAFHDSVAKQAFEWCEKILHVDVRKTNIVCKKSSQPYVRKSDIPCEENLQDKENDNNKDNKSDNVLSTLSDQDFIEILYPIFFFKNNNDPIAEIKRFVEFYEAKNWKLGGGKMMCNVGDLIRSAESWKVMDIRETGFHPYFMKAWMEVYKEAPDALKWDLLKIKTPQRSPTSSMVICSDAVNDWLNDNREMVELIFKSRATYNYKIEWQPIAKSSI